jgi:hypothetical protein
VNVLVGSTGKRSFVSQLQDLKWGRMFVTSKPHPYPLEPWGFDNGAFASWKNGTEWDADAYLKRLDKAYKVGTPYLAVVPDKVGKGRESLDFSMSWLDSMPQEWNLYLAIQDGMTFQDVIAVVDNFDGIFLGGTDAFKVQARDWCDLAHRHNKKFHYARCGIEWKIRHAQRIGADSLDSAFPMFTVSRWKQFIHNITCSNEQLILFQEAHDDQ